jgi:hypothetical protein
MAKKEKAPQFPVTLTAATREELAAKYDEMKDQHAGETLMAGCVARSKDDGTFKMTITTI